MNNKCWRCGLEHDYGRLLIYQGRQWCTECVADDKYGGVMLLHGTADASVWAAEFKRLFPDSDELLMLGWFANAIETGKKHERRRKGASRTFFRMRDWVDMFLRTKP